MNLLYRTTRDFVIATAIILLVTATALYLLLQKEVKEEMEEQLAFQSELAEKNLIERNEFSSPFIQTTLTTDPVSQHPVYGDTLILDVVQKKEEEYHYRIEVKKINGQHYRIFTMISYIGWNEYFKTIFILIGSAILLLGGSSVAITYFSNKKRWRPFFQNLAALKSYSITNNQQLLLKGSPITEFKELNEALADLAARSRKEYVSLREFTENASHEIQTPLGIIQSKLDRLSQLSISEEMARYIVQAKIGVDRLSKMNKALLLLAKLDNNAFEEKQELAFHDLLTQHLEMMADLFASRTIALHSQISPCILTANPYLCEILLSNLVSNAFRHTEFGGQINIGVNFSRLTISNPGPELDFPPEQLFNRFTKSAGDNHGTGLGLAIVYQICSINDWKIDYTYLEGNHTFMIFFVKTDKLL